MLAFLLSCYCHIDLWLQLLFCAVSGFLFLFFIYLYKKHENKLRNKKSKKGKSFFFLKKKSHNLQHVFLYFVFFYKEIKILNSARKTQYLTFAMAKQALFGFLGIYAIGPLKTNYKCHNVKKKVWELKICMQRQRFAAKSCFSKCFTFGYSLSQKGAKNLSL